jgi:L-malate glycosyltransferase
MRILQLVTRRQRRGAEVFAAQLSDALTRRGHDVLVVGLYEAPHDPLVPAAADHRDLDGSSRGRLSLSRIRQLARLVSRISPDVVQANGSDTLKYSVLARSVARGRWPLVYRNISIASQWLRYPGQRAWGRLLVRQVERVAAVSEDSRIDFIRTYGIPPERIRTIPIGVELSRSASREQLRTRLRAEAGLPEKVPVLVHVGSFSPEKNHLWLLEAFREIRGAEADAHLVLIGDGALRPEVERRAKDAGLRDAVRFLGSRADASELIGGGDVFLLPSRIEGLPGVILEAAAHSIPSVATDVGSIGEVVRDGETGRLIRAGDLETFVSATVGLLRDEELRTQLGGAAFERVRDRYSMEAIVDEFESLYFELVPGRSPSQAGSA